ncbi:MAG: thiamine pyrophosphate-dependent dehydrogenase E1 component subunit alpha [Betaproteobacteria bacterium]|nr:thiamine pyrophosphate-dependent dehydrogenase E1 component subunit alpha [Betaproteobacteria bacterium]
MIRYGYRGTGFADWKDRDLPQTPAFCTSLLRDMIRIREIEEEIERRYHQDQMKTPIHLVIGQEAASVGFCSALTRDDLLYSGHRTHGAYLAKGGDLRAMLCEMHCRINGCAGSRGGSMHLIDKSVGMAGTSAIVGGAVPISAGAALALKMKGSDRLAAVFLGDAATEEGVVAETLNFAALKRLPLVFLCENNFYSVQSPLFTRQPVRDIHKWAASHGVESVQVDGMNVLDVHDATAAAVERARHGGGATFIEAIVYRYRAHGGAGDDSKTGYRSLEEVREWERVDPVTTYGEFLKERRLVSEDDVAQMHAESRREVGEAFEFALASPEPTEKDLYTHVYSD